MFRRVLPSQNHRPIPRFAMSFPQPVSENMQPGESPDAAVARAVWEDLGAHARVWILGAAGAGVRE